MLKLGTSDLLLSASNSFTGPVTISAGAVRVSHGRALGTTSSGCTVEESGELHLENNILLAGETLTCAGGKLASTGASTNTWTGNIILNSNATFEVTGVSQLILSNVISGPGGINKMGAGLLRYDSDFANTYSGVTAVSSGAMIVSKSPSTTSIAGDLVIGDGAGFDLFRLEASNQIANSSAVTINSSGEFELGAQIESVGSLEGSGHLNTGSSPAFECGNNNSSTVFNGLISGSGSLNKGGAGTFTLTGTNTYTGSTTVGQGSLLINGSQPQSPVRMQNNAVLGGTGIVGTIASLALGALAPGAGPGILTCSNLNLTAVGSALM